MRWEIHHGFSRQVAELYNRKIKFGYPLDDREREIVCGGVRNYREVLKALFLSLNKVKPSKDVPTITLALNFSRGIQ